MKYTTSVEQGIFIDPNITPPGPASIDNLDQFYRYVGHSNYAGLFGITLSEGSGAYVKDLDGNRYLDCLAGASANILGYGCQEVADNYHRVATKMQHSCVPYSINEDVVHLAKILSAHFPGQSDASQQNNVVENSQAPYQSLFGLSGSDGVGGALCAMRKYTGRFGVLYFNNAYHGSTGLSQQASGFATLKSGLYPPDVNFVALDFPVWDPNDEQGSIKRRDKTLELIKRHLESGLIGGLLSEPIQGDGGVHFPCPGFFPEVKQLLSEYDALLIIDEVQSGMGRTGSLWAIEHEKVEPDIIVSAKGLSAGFAPISAAIGRTEVLNTLGSAQQIFTYSGHGPSCAAALTTLQLILRNQLVSNASIQGEKLINGLKDIQKKFPQVIKDVRGIGLMIGVEINTHGNSWAAKIFATRGVQLGIYFGFFGSENHVVRIEPPLIIDDHAVNLILHITEQVAEEMANDSIPEITYKNTMKYALGL